jgi:hypothetical protein
MDPRLPLGSAADFVSGQRILSPFYGHSPNSATRYQVVFTDVSAVKASSVWLGTNTYPPHLPLIFLDDAARSRPLGSAVMMWRTCNGNLSFGS